MWKNFLQRIFLPNGAAESVGLHSRYPALIV